MNGFQKRFDVLLRAVLPWESHNATRLRAEVVPNLDRRYPRELVETVKPHKFCCLDTKIQ